MFSGIVIGCFPVIAATRQGEQLRLTLSLSESVCEGLVLGASVAVDGVCLTVVQIEGQAISFDVIAATLACTTLGSLKVGDWVNIERSLRLGDEVGGHVVEGHVWGCGILVACQDIAHSRSLSLHCPAPWYKYIGLKGYVAVNGVSVTVAALEAERQRFHVHLIPETLRLTNLEQLQIGSSINIEVDARHRAIVDTVEHWLTSHYK